MLSAGETMTDRKTTGHPALEVEPMHVDWIAAGLQGYPLSEERARQLTVELGTMSQFMAGQRAGAAFEHEPSLFRAAQHKPGKPDAL